LILVGIILIGLGVETFFGPKLIPFYGNQVMTIGVVVLAALILFLVLAGSVKTYVGMVVTALWLLLIGVMSWLNLAFPPYTYLILAALPVGAGIFMLLGI